MCNLYTFCDHFTFHHLCCTVFILIIEHNEEQKMYAAVNLRKPTLYSGCYLKCFRLVVWHFCFNVSLTVHLSITLDNDQLDAQIFFINTFITILYVYMFRAISCSSSGGQIILIQHLVLSLSVNDHLVHLCTGRSLTESDDTRCCISTI